MNILIGLFSLIVLITGCAHNKQIHEDPRDIRAASVQHAKRTNCDKEPILITNLTLPEKQRVYLKRDETLCDE